MDRRVKQEPPAGGTASPSNGSPIPSPLPTSSNYTDFVLRSSAPSSLSGWKHNVMKFTALGNRVIDPSNDELFVRPVKLNRKDPRTVRRLTDEDRERHNKRAMQKAAELVGQSMDVDQKPGEGDVKGEVKDEEGAGEGASGTGKTEKEELDPSLVGRGANGGGMPNRRGPGGQFKKKTKRVYVASEESRRLKREEWQPWVLEDDEGKERWIGRLEGGVGEVGSSGGAGRAAEQGKVAQAGDRNGSGLSGWRPAANAGDVGSGSSYVAFVFGDNGDEFKVVPVNRWYRFNQGPKYLTLAEEEAEEEYARQQKSKEPERWIMHRRAAPTTSSGSSTPRTGSSGANGGVSASSLRSRMVANAAAGTRADPDDSAGDDSRGRSKIKTVVSAGKRNAAGQHQDEDEFDYEEDFADDEEGIAKIDDLADEEEAKELEERIRREQRAAERGDQIPDDDEDEEIERLTGTGKEIKKMIKKSDKTGAYDSEDDEENPYASDDNDSDTASVTSAGADRPSSRAASPNPHAHRASPLPRSRAGTPSGSGSAYVAKRATSPSGGHGSRSASPSGGKRKRDTSVDGGAGSDSDIDGTKRRKSAKPGGGKGKSPSPGAPVALLTQADLVAFFKTRPNLTAGTKDVLTHFRKQIKGDERNKAAIGGLLQAVANLEGGSLVLKAGL
ncbi:hypothetical protein JCM11251_004077 [Rhodosporidiobolus azoricus]